MKGTIEKIIKHNTPEDAADKILILITKSMVKSQFSIDDIRKAFLGGRDSVEAKIGYYPWGDMEEYAKKEIVKSFKQYMHENYKQIKSISEI